MRSLMSDADMAAGMLMVAALLVRGSARPHGVRREWKWMVAFAVAGAVGGRFPYACSEGLSAACRALEWHLQLPLHHYIHVVSGIAEFATLTTAAVIAMRRTRNDGTRRVAHLLGDRQGADRELSAPRAWSTSPTGWGPWSSRSSSSPSPSCC